MRLFIAILPDEAMRQTLTGLQNALQDLDVRGRYTDPYNLHLTLAFIGEYGNPDQILDVMEEIPMEPFSLTLKEAERFHDLYVCTPEENRALETYVRRLRRALSEHDIPFDRKAFLPHITLVRKANEADIDSLRVPPRSMEVSCISLMKSDRGSHGMIYSEIDSIDYSELSETDIQKEVNMADTKEMSRKWKMSPDTVARLCREGMIPSAEKIKGAWSIPGDAIKPPCTAWMAAKYLHAIELINEGAAVDFYLYHKPVEELVDSFEYLRSIGFCTDFRWVSENNEIDFIRTLSGVKLTSDGLDLIASMKEDSGHSVEISAGGKLGGGVIPAEVNAGVKYSGRKKG